MADTWFPEGFDVTAHRRTGGAHVDHALTGLADAQHGVVTARQLLALGFSGGQVRRRVRSGHLVRHGRGVYLVGHAGPTTVGLRTAGVMGAGRGALLAGLSGAAHLGAEVVEPRAVHVIVPPGRRVERPGVRARAAVVPQHERAVVNGVPCLTWPRVLLDVAAHHGRRALDDLWRQAVYRKVLHLLEIRRLLAEHHGEPGTVAVRRLLGGREAAIGAAANRLEADMRDLVLAAGMPEPRVNMPMWIDGVRLRPDLHIPERALVLETDGRAAHEDPERRRDDVRRDALYRSAGLTVCRYGWWAVTYERFRVEAELARYEQAWRVTGGRWTAAVPQPRFTLAR